MITVPFDYFVAPEGFNFVPRVDGDIRLLHIASGKQARVSGVAVKMDSRQSSVQREIEYACSKLLRELER